MSNWYAPESNDGQSPQTSENPFAAGEAWDEAPDSADDLNDIAVGDRVEIDGKLLVVEPGTVLPQICVKTGATSDLKQMPVKLKYSPPWAFAVGGVILATLMSKTCAVTYFVSNELVARNARFNLIGAIGLFIGIATVVFGAISGLMVLVGLAVVIIIASLICFAIGNISLTITKQEDGTRFWLSGCDASFLDKVARLGA